ncbi:MAG TPA: class I SAM-dependent methyltransferase [Polyangiales bacterium]|nr:class I SAM-dependent methyltransferase [Polyangiales bacterium]
MKCVVCGAAASASVRTAEVPSNVKPFAHERFVVWQCAGCGTIHARDEVDLGHYYAQYPFRGQKLDLPTRVAFANKLKKLEKLGLRKQHAVLDYGCGSGLFVQFLQSKGYTHASGYDAYAGAGPYAKLPDALQDAILAQDVIEHVADPAQFLRELKQLAKPGALVVLGTPNAEVVDLDDAMTYVHLLHQPYHRHIMSADAIGTLATAQGMAVADVDKTFYGNSALPGLNALFLSRVLRASNDVLDDVLAGKVPLKPELFTPAALWDAFTGSRRDPGFDLTIALRL